MAFLRPEDEQQLRQIFSPLVNDVAIEVVSDDLDLRLLVDELAATGGGRIVVTKRAPEAGEEQPMMKLSSPLAKGTLVFAGLPVGYEMATLVAAITDLGGAGGDPVSPDAQAQLDALAKPVVIEVFSTPG